MGSVGCNSAAYCTECFVFAANHTAQYALLLRPTGLGGMTSADLPQAFEHGAQGVAAIRALWEA